VADLTVVIAKLQTKKKTKELMEAKRKRQSLQRFSEEEQNQAIRLNASPKLLQQQRSLVCTGAAA